jgi:thioredoxin:protein disulfide reductase
MSIFLIVLRCVLITLLLLLSTVRAQTNTTGLPLQSLPPQLKTSVPTIPLDPQQAFQLSATGNGIDVYLKFNIADNYYLYKDKTQIFLKAVEINKATKKPDSDQIIIESNLPAGIIKFDETFSKNLEVYRQQLIIPVRLPASFTSSSIPTIDLFVDSQGCADLGICYPPLRHRIVVSKTFNYDKANNNNNNNDNLSYLVEPVDVVNDTNLFSTQTVRDSNSIVNNAIFDAQWWWVILSFLGFGLLLSFTPCVLPMVPIVLAIVLRGTDKATADGNLTTQRNYLPLAMYSRFYKALVYVLAMACTYAVLGVVAAKMGASVNAYFQQPAVLIGFSLLILIFAGAQFGWYEIKLPNALFNRLNQSNNPSSNTSWFSIALIGCLSAIMVGPCVTAPLAAALTFIAKSGDVWAGGLALFSMGVGMGIPLLVLAVGGSALLPKPGVWLLKVNYIIGILLIGLALWTVQSLLPSWLNAIAWVAVLVLLAEGMGGFDVAVENNTRLVKLFKALAWLIMAWAVAIVWGMLAGRFDPLQPLLASQSAPQLPDPASSVKHANTNQTDSFTRVSSDSVSQILNTNTEKPVLLDIYADWCVSCIEFERSTLRHPSVQRLLPAFNTLRVDVTKNTTADQALLKQFGIFGPPAMLFFSPNGQEFSTKRVIGFQDATAFSQHLATMLK